MNDFKFKKRRVEVALYVEASVARAHVFLGHASGVTGGPETLASVLGSGAKFLPTVVNGAFTCVPLEALSAVVCTEADAVDTGQSLGPETTLRVEAKTLAGKAFAGTLRFSRPAADSRLYDYLEEGPTFIPLRLSSGEVALLNRGRLAWVREAASKTKKKARRK